MECVDNPRNEKLLICWFMNLFTKPDKIKERLTCAIYSQFFDILAEIWFVHLSIIDTLTRCATRCHSLPFVASLIVTRFSSRCYSSVFL